MIEDKPGQKRGNAPWGFLRARTRGKTINTKFVSYLWRFDANRRQVPAVNLLYSHATPWKVTWRCIAIYRIRLLNWLFQTFLLAPVNFIVNANVLIPFTKQSGLLFSTNFVAVANVAYLPVILVLRLEFDDAAKSRRCFLFFFYWRLWFAKYS